MKKIRKSIFETNSSSTHSLVIHLNDNIDELIKKVQENNDNIFLFSKDIYDKLIDRNINSGIRFSDFDLKLIFLLAVANNNKLINLMTMVLDILKKYKFKLYLNTEATKEDNNDNSIKQKLEKVDNIEDAVIKIKDILDSSLWRDTGFLKTPIFDYLEEKDMFLKLFLNEENIIKFLFSDNSFFIEIFYDNFTYEAFPEEGLNIVYRSSNS